MPRTPKPAPEPVRQTSTPRVKARLDRLRREGLTEVRGAMAHPDDHAAVKTFAKMLAAQRAEKLTS